MQAIFFPAIKFMNRLSYAYKFGLISFLFLAQILVLSYVWVDNSYTTIRISKDELASVKDVQRIMQVVKLSEEHRDVTSVFHFYPQAGLSEESTRKRRELKSAILELQQQFKGRDLASEIDEYRTRWLSRTSGDGINQPTFIDQFRFYNDFTNGLVSIARERATSSGLSQDENREVQLIMSLILDQYQSVRDAAGLARTAGIFSYQENYLASHTFDHLNDVFDTLIDGEKKQQKIHSFVASDLPQVRAQFKNQLNQSIESFKKLKNRLDEDIIAATDLNSDWKTYNSAATADIESLHTVTQKLFPLVEELIQTRLDTQERQLTILVTALATVLGLIFYLYTAFYISINATVSTFHNATHRIAKGDMNVRIKSYAQDEMGALTTEFNYMTEQIHDLILAVKETAKDVGIQSSQVENAATQSSQAATRQLQATNEVVTAISEMKASADAVSTSSSDAATAAESASSETTSATVMVGEALNSIENLAGEINTSAQVINQLAESSSSISNLLDVIKSIAEQTNLLALNAAIEAARAGEQGRGFAVVADEVRTLASRTQASAQEIEEVMTGLQGGVSKAVKTMNTSHKMAQDTVEESNKIQHALERINESVASIVERNTDISSAAAAQAQVTETIDTNIASINAQGQSTAEGAEDTLRSIKEMGRLTKSMYERMSQFEV